MPWTLYLSGKESSEPIEYEARWAQYTVSIFWGTEKSRSPARIKPQIVQIVQPVA